MKKNVVVFMFHKYNNNDIQCLIQLSEQSMSKSLKWKTVVHIILIFKKYYNLYHRVVTCHHFCSADLFISAAFHESGACAERTKNGSH